MGEGCCIRCENCENYKAKKSERKKHEEFHLERLRCLLKEGKVELQRKSIIEGTSFKVTSFEEKLDYVVSSLFEAGMITYEALILGRQKIIELLKKDGDIKYSQHEEIYRNSKSQKQAMKYRKRCLENVL